VKVVVFGIMDGENKRGRSSSEWIDDIKEWCQTDIHTLISMAQDRSQWRRIVNEALDTNGREPARNEEEEKKNGAYIYVCVQASRLCYCVK